MWLYERTHLILLERLWKVKGQCRSDSADHIPHTPLDLVASNLHLLDIQVAGIQHHLLRITCSHECDERMAVENVFSPVDRPFQMGVLYSDLGIV